jgi:DNA-binding response OmpR family regulator
MSKNVLIVDDQKEWFDVLNMAEHSDLNFVYLESPDKVVDTIKTEYIDLVLMDWDLGTNTKSGVQTIKDIRDYLVTANIPIIMFSGKTDSKDMSFAINQGADDYISKPFDLDLLMAKVKAHLRKHGVEGQSRKHYYRNILINEDSLSIELKNKEYSFSKKEFTIVKALITNPDKTFSREELNIMDCPYYNVSARTIDTLMTKIRKKFNDEKIVQTVSKKGYRINPKIFG